MSHTKTPNDSTLTYILVNDMAGITRGRGFPAKNSNSHIQKGVGWVPINQTITPFDDIPYPGQWGPVGDCRLIPDPTTEVKIDLENDLPPLHFYLADIIDLDNNPSPNCPRNLLKQALSELKNKTGLSMLVSFEHEFVLTDLPETEKFSGFSYRKARFIEPLGQHLMSAMDQAGLEPEAFLPEFAPHQYEITCKPSSALVAADRAVILREVVKEVSINLGHKASFSPKIDPQRLGSGVHIHFSFRDENGKPATYDPNRPGNVSEVTGQFVGGILKHLPALCAFTAPSVVSYQRIQPHSWSGAFTCFGEHNREAAVRISPVYDPDGTSTESQFNMEFRVADATANPHLALAMMIKAGLEGFKQRYPQPPLVNTDPADLTEEEAARLNVVRLPQSLEDALTCWQEDKVAFNWLNETMRTSYLALKETEINSLVDKSDDEICLAYRTSY